MVRAAPQSDHFLKKVGVLVLLFQRACLHCPLICFRVEGKGVIYLVEKEQGKCIWSPVPHLLPRMGWRSVFSSFDQTK